MLPVSKYEELLHTVRSLKQQTIRVHQLASPLLDTIVTANERLSSSSKDIGNLPIPDDCWDKHQRDFDCQDDLDDLPGLTSMDSLVVEHTGTKIFDEPTQSNFHETDLPSPLPKKPPPNMSVSSEPDSSDHRNVSLLYHGTWPVERAMWNSEPPNLRNHQANNQIEVTSVMSFASSSGAAPLDHVLNEDIPCRTSQQLEVKVDMVYSLLSMLGTQECPDMGETLLALSSSPDSSLAMRQAGCLPVLVQLVYSDKDRETRVKASKALFNLIQVQTDDKLRRREIKVIRLLDEIRGYCDLVHESGGSDEVKNRLEDHPTQATETIIKLSFDEGYRQTICELGGIYALANLIEADHVAHSTETDREKCVMIRRYAGMALTNLTFGHSHNKALLCSFRDFMKCLVTQLKSGSDELRQVTASVIRNLSWRADASSRLILREVGCVPALMSAAIVSHKESTLKSILSALWNLSAHCSMNKADICSVEGALGFLVDMLSFKPPSKTLAIIENAGGILRNISSHIAVREDYRAVLREHNCLQVLLQQLKSPSLTIVSNACGTLWNLSAKCAEDQKTLWDLGAAPMLKSLNHSKHIMIATGSRAALKNLLSSRPTHNLFTHVDMTAKELGLPALPTLGVRKQRALAKELDQNLSETCDNIEPTSPMFETVKAQRKFKYYDDSEHSTLVDGFNSLSLNDSVRYSMKSTKIYTKIADRSFDDDLGDSCDQPIDYSQKYSENKGFTKKKEFVKKYNYNYPEKNDVYPDGEKKEEPLFEPVDYSRKYGESSTTGTVPKPKKDYVPYQTDYYAETDLDQPTNYSLRYGENDSDTEPSHDPQPTQFYEQDTIKTYCTEGTPYETPYNFSNATSLSDLRIENSEEVKPTVDLKSEKTDETKPDVDDNSGLMSPEKPVNYCEEGTPGYFSRVSSLSSLNVTADAVQGDVKDEKDETDGKDEGKGESKGDREGTKVVTFGQVVDYAEETPLMFSRCSSLGSLSSTEQHSIHDDRSSVSDFSRLTSGIISPSELPDSPTQTVPPSPRHRKSSSDDFPPATQDATQPMPKSVFEDNVIKFKEVNTPVEFSTNTSLSSLTIDDEPSVPTKLTLLQDGSIKRNTDGNVTDGKTNDVAENKTDLSTVSEEEEEDENILAACINIGMQNNRHRQNKQAVPLPKRSHIPSALPKFQPKPSSSRTGIPVKLRSPKMEPCSDTLQTYCTEDTPAMLSNAGSHSDLSILSIMSKPSRDDKPEFSDDSSNLSGDNDNILAECIQSGMPKAVPKCAGLKMWGAKDEVERYAVEDSPCHFSLRSSLSDLTVDGGATGKVEKKFTSPNCKKELSRQESLSSLSVESYGSTENAEQALLEQCISIGMPKSKIEETESKNEFVTSVATDIRRVTDGMIRGGDGNVAVINGYDDNLDNHPKNGYEINKCSDVLTDYSVEDNASPDVSDSESKARNRMLDPDAMIESLDRFTAELVSHSSHLNSHRASNDCGTWSDDTSPNDISFPSISISAPMIASFKSETASDRIPDTTMTESTIIAMEATKLINENMQQSITSMNSLDLEHINPPSIMESLVSMTSSISSPKYSPVATRKRSLPPGLMVRRALGNAQKSLENLNDISITSNLEQQKPPSVMGDYLDMVDMESSMVSVASLTSDVCEKTDIENINPPSILNDSTADVITENVYSESTDVFEDCFTHTIVAQTVDEITEYSDANSSTPVQSDFGSSSNESTPKKTRSIGKKLTPKQKRQLTKERYKTYTVAAEMVIKEDAPKLTPKERRLLDRERFQTRVLDPAPIAEPDITTRFATFTRTSLQMSMSKTEVESATSSIPRPASPRTKTDIRKAMQQKRLENKDRFRTRTITHSNTTSPEISPLPDRRMLTSDELQQEAKIILNTLENTSNVDELLDCETLSLVSNEDSSEHNSISSSVNYRTYHKSWGFSKNLPVVEAKPNLQITTQLVTNIVAIEEKKPKIVKPDGEVEVEQPVEPQKAIRGKKKAAYVSPYRSPNTTRSKPTVTSNLVKNVTQSLKTGSKIATASNRSSVPVCSSKKTIAQPKRQSLPPKIERQGTFVKEESSSSTTTTESPESPKPPLPKQSTSKIARAITAKSKSASQLKPPQKLQSKIVTSTSTSRFYNRSPSADRSKPIQNSSSSQSLQGAKRTSIPSLTQRSNSNVSIGSDTSKKKQVTSKIASLWKRVEESKKKSDKKDNKVWLTPSKTDVAACDSTTILTF